MAKEKFEEALNKLEKIVERLEKGDIPLEESLKLFEEGVRLSTFCSHKLDEAEKRVEILLKGKEGSLKPQPFEPSAPSVLMPTKISGPLTEDSDSSNPSALGHSRTDQGLFPDEEE